MPITGFVAVPKIRTKTTRPYIAYITGTFVECCIEPAEEAPSGGGGGEAFDYAAGTFEKHFFCKKTYNSYTINPIIHGVGYGVITIS